MEIFLTTGLLGGLTTFSAFSLEVALMVEHNAYAMAAAYVLISVTGSVAGLFIGLISMRHFT
jgi:CrcB protein